MALLNLAAKSIMSAPKIFRPLALARPMSSFTKDGFHVSLDVQEYSPGEITVKTNKQCITIEGQHQKQDEFGFFSRHFVRRYVLPKNYDLETVKSSLSPEGILTVKTAPPKSSIEDKDEERAIPIETTKPDKKAINE